MIAWLVLSTACASASRAILDSESRANADVLRIKRGAKKITTTGGSYDPVEESRAALKFSFVLKGAGSSGST